MYSKGALQDIDGDWEGIESCNLYHITAVSLRSSVTCHSWEETVVHSSLAKEKERKEEQLMRKNTDFCVEVFI